MSEEKILRNIQEMVIKLPELEFDPDINSGVDQWINTTEKVLKIRDAVGGTTNFPLDEIPATGSPIILKGPDIFSVGEHWGLEQHIVDPSNLVEGYYLTLERKAPEMSRTVAGINHSLALDVQGKVWSWGKYQEYNGELEVNEKTGQLGNPSYNGNPLPMHDGFNEGLFVTDAVDFFVGQDHSYIKRKDNSWWYCGKRSFEGVYSVAGNGESFCIILPNVDYVLIKKIYNVDREAGWVKRPLPVKADWRVIGFIPTHFTLDYINQLEPFQKGDVVTGVTSGAIATIDSGALQGNYIDSGSLIVKNRIPNLDFQSDETLRVGSADKATVKISASYRGFFSKGTFCTLAYNSDVAVYSEDGKEWVQVTLPISGKWIDCCYTENYFLAISEEGYVIKTSDGINWSFLALNIVQPEKSLAYNNLQTGKSFAVNDVVIGHSSGITAIVADVVPDQAELNYDGAPVAAVQYYKDMLYSRLEYDNAQPVTGDVYKGFDAGQILVGETSGASAVIKYSFRATATIGVVYVDDIHGIFEDDEILLVANEYVANVNSTTSAIRSFKIGDTVKGKWSGTVGAVASSQPLGPTGWLTLIDIAGTFQDIEPLIRNDDGFEFCKADLETLPISIFYKGDVVKGVLSNAHARVVENYYTGILSYDTLQDGKSFNVDDIVYGGTSGTTGKITLVDAPNKKLTLETVLGSFQDNEHLLVDNDFIAKVNGKLIVTSGKLVVDKIVGSFINNEHLEVKSIYLADVDGTLMFKSGILSLGSVSGSFQDDEQLYISGEHVANANGISEDWVGGPITWQTIIGKYHTVIALAKNSSIAVRSTNQGQSFSRVSVPIKRDWASSIACWCPGQINQDSLYFLVFAEGSREYLRSQDGSSWKVYVFSTAGEIGFDTLQYRDWQSGTVKGETTLFAASLTYEKEDSIDRYAGQLTVELDYDTLLSYNSKKSERYVADEKLLSGPSELYVADADGTITGITAFLYVNQCARALRIPFKNGVPALVNALSPGDVLIENISGKSVTLSGIDKRERLTYKNGRQSLSQTSDFHITGKWSGAKASVREIETFYSKTLGYKDLLEKGTLKYDHLESGRSFSPSDTITGQSSGATASVLDMYITEVSVSGILTIGSVSGLFENNEKLLVGGITIAESNGIYKKGFSRGDWVVGRDTGSRGYIIDCDETSSSTGVLKLVQIEGDFDWEDVEEELSVNTLPGVIIATSTGVASDRSEGRLVIADRIGTFIVGEPLVIDEWKTYFADVDQVTQGVFGKLFYQKIDKLDIYGTDGSGNIKRVKGCLHYDNLQPLRNFFIGFIVIGNTSGKTFTVTAVFEDPRTGFEKCGYLFGDEASITEINGMIENEPLRGRVNHFANFDCVDWDELETIFLTNEWAPDFTFYRKNFQEVNEHVCDCEQWSPQVVNPFRRYDIITGNTETARILTSEISSPAAEVSPGTFRALDIEACLYVDQVSGALSGTVIVEDVITGAVCQLGPQMQSKYPSASEIMDPVYGLVKYKNKKGKEFEVADIITGVSSGTRAVITDISDYVALREGWQFYHELAEIGRINFDNIQTGRSFHVNDWVLGNSSKARAEVSYVFDSGNVHVLFLSDFARTQLFYDHLQSGKYFLVGDVIVGATSEARAIVTHIFSDSIGLSSIWGTFQNDEHLQVNGIYIADVNGVLWENLEFLDDEHLYVDGIYIANVNGSIQYGFQEGDGIEVVDKYGTEDPVLPVGQFVDHFKENRGYFILEQQGELLGPVVEVPYKNLIAGEDFDVGFDVVGEESGARGTVLEHEPEVGDLHFFDLEGGASFDIGDQVECRYSGASGKVLNKFSYVTLDYDNLQPDKGFYVDDHVTGMSTAVTGTVQAVIGHQTVNALSFDNYQGVREFYPGEHVIGNTSSAKALIQKVERTGLVGVLWLVSIDGVFQNNEHLHVGNDLYLADTDGIISTTYGYGSLYIKNASGTFVNDEHLNTSHGYIAIVNGAPINNDSGGLLVGNVSLGRGFNCRLLNESIDGEALKGEYSGGIVTVSDSIRAQFLSFKNYQKLAGKVFNVGTLIRGFTSNAEAIILYVDESSLKLRLIDVEGTFQDNEKLLVDDEHVANADGTLWDTLIVDYVNKLNYKSLQPGQVFHISDIVSGATSHQTSIVEYVEDHGGGTGTLVVSNYTGIYIKNENLKVNNVIIATCNTFSIIGDLDVNKTIIGVDSGATALVKEIDPQCWTRILELSCMTSVSYSGTYRDRDNNYAKFGLYELLTSASPDHWGTSYTLATCSGGMSGPLYEVQGVGQVANLSVLSVAVTHPRDGLLLLRNITDTFQNGEFLTVDGYVVAKTRGLVTKETPYGRVLLSEAKKYHTLEPNEWLMSDDDRACAIESNQFFSQNFKHGEAVYIDDVKKARVLYKPQYHFGRLILDDTKGFFHDGETLSLDKGIITFDNLQSGANFKIDGIVRGIDSLAFATLVDYSVDEANKSGSLYLGDIHGEFEIDEEIHIEGSYVGDVASLVDYHNVAIVNAGARGAFIYLSGTLHGWDTTPLLQFFSEEDPPYWMPSEPPAYLYINGVQFAVITSATEMNKGAYLNINNIEGIFEDGEWLEVDGVYIASAKRFGRQICFTPSGQVVQFEDDYERRNWKNATWSRQKGLFLLSEETMENYGSLFIYNLQIHRRCFQGDIIEGETSGAQAEVVGYEVGLDYIVIYKLNDIDFQSKERLFVGDYYIADVFDGDSSDFMVTTSSIQGLMLKQLGINVQGTSWTPDNDVKDFLWTGISTVSPDAPIGLTVAQVTSHLSNYPAEVVHPFDLMPGLDPDETLLDQGWPNYEGMKKLVNSPYLGDLCLMNNGDVWTRGAELFKWSAVAYNSTIFVAFGLNSDKVARGYFEDVLEDELKLKFYERVSAQNFDVGDTVVGHTSGVSGIVSVGTYPTTEPFPDPRSLKAAYIEFQPGTVSGDFLESELLYKNGKQIARVEHWLKTIDKSKLRSSVTYYNLPSSKAWSSVVWNGSVFCAVARNSDSAATSSDGITWLARTLPVIADWNLIVAHGSTLIAFIYQSKTYAVSSDNGVSWGTYSTLPAVGNWSAGASSGSKLVVFSENSNLVVVTTNLVSWTSNGLPYGGLYWSSVVWNGSVFCVVARNSPFVVTSSDGNTWTHVGTFHDINGANSIIAVGSTLYVEYWKSIDNGITWTNVLESSWDSLPIGDTLIGTIYRQADLSDHKKNSLVFICNDGVVKASSLYEYIHCDTVTVTINNDDLDDYTTEAGEWLQITELDNIVDIAAGNKHFLFLDSDGAVYAMGDNQYGQLGNNSTVDSLYPTQITQLASMLIEKIFSEGNKCWGINDSGNVYAWGENQYGELGLNPSLWPVRGPLISTFLQDSIIITESYALKSDGTIWSLEDRKQLWAFIGSCSDLSQKDDEVNFVGSDRMLWTLSESGIPLQKFGERTSVIDMSKAPSDYQALVFDNNTIWGRRCILTGSGEVSEFIWRGDNIIKALIGRHMNLQYFSSQPPGQEARFNSAFSQYCFFLKEDGTVWAKTLLLYDSEEITESYNKAYLGTTDIAFSLISTNGKMLHFNTCLDWEYNLDKPHGQFMLANIPTGIEDVGFTSEVFFGIKSGFTNRGYVSRDGFSWDEVILPFTGDWIIAHYDRIDHYISGIFGGTEYDSYSDMKWGIPLVILARGQGTVLHSEDGVRWNGYFITPIIEQWKKVIAAKEFLESEYATEAHSCTYFAIVDGSVNYFYMSTNIKKWVKKTLPITATWIDLIHIKINNATENVTAFLASDQNKIIYYDWNTGTCTTINLPTRPTGSTWKSLARTYSAQLAALPSKGNKAAVCNYVSSPTTWSECTLPHNATSWNVVLGWTDKKFIIVSIADNKAYVSENAWSGNLPVESSWVEFSLPAGASSYSYVGASRFTPLGLPSILRNHTKTPVQLEGLTGITQISFLYAAYNVHNEKYYGFPVSGMFPMVIKNDGTVWIWSPIELQPRQLTGLTNISQIGVDDEGSADVLAEVVVTAKRIVYYKTKQVGRSFYSPITGETSGAIITSFLSTVLGAASGYLLISSMTGNFIDGERLMVGGKYTANVEGADFSILAVGGNIEGRSSGSTGTITSVTELTKHTARIQLNNVKAKTSYDDPFNPWYYSSTPPGFQNSEILNIVYRSSYDPQEPLRGYIYKTYSGTISSITQYWFRDRYYALKSDGTVWSWTMDRETLEVIESLHQIPKLINIEEIHIGPPNVAINTDRRAYYFRGSDSIGEYVILIPRLGQIKTVSCGGVSDPVQGYYRQGIAIDYDNKVYRFTEWLGDTLADQWDVYWKRFFPVEITERLYDTIRSVFGSANIESIQYVSDRYWAFVDQKGKLYHLQNSLQFPYSETTPAFTELVKYCDYLYYGEKGEWVFTLDLSKVGKIGSFNLGGSITNKYYRISHDRGQTWSDWVNGYGLELILWVGLEVYDSLLQIKYSLEVDPDDWTQSAELNLDIEIQPE